MRVQEIMSSNVRTCRPETNLAEAASMMLRFDCGALPVVTADNHLAGMLTDRDIAIAAGLKNQPASTIQVREVMSGRVHSVNPDDDVHAALKVMRHEKVRRVPVISQKGLLQGVLSINDVLLRAEEERGKRHPALNYEDAMGTIKAICEHRPGIAKAVSG